MRDKIITSTKIVRTTSVLDFGDVLLIATLHDRTETKLATYFSDENTGHSLRCIDFNGASLRWAREEIRLVYNREYGIQFGVNPHQRAPKLEEVVTFANEAAPQFVETADCRPEDVVALEPLDLEELDF